MSPSPRRSLLPLLVCLALAPVGAAAAPEGQRVVGLGWNAAGGILAGDGEAGLIWELAAPELRLFLSDRVALDLQWDVVGMIRARAAFGRGQYLQRTYLHLFHEPQARTSFAVAPYLLTGIGAAEGATYGSLGLGSRVGVDLFDPSGRFGLGLYGRPGFLVTGVTGVRPAAGLEFLLEVTWTFYPPRRQQDTLKMPD